MTEFAVRRPVSVLMIAIGLCMLGWISARKTPIQLLPEMKTPEFRIVTELKGASPDEMESQVTIPLERAVSTTAGLLKTESVSERERSEIRLKFKGSIDYLETFSGLRDKIDSTGLPEGAGKPRLERSAANAAPILRVGFSPQGVDLAEAAERIEEKLVRKLEKVDGVATVRLLGAPQREIVVDVDPVLAASMEIPISSISETIASKNKTIPVGEVQTQGRRVGIRVGKGIGSIEDLRSLVVKKTEKRITRLGDIAKIHEAMRRPAPLIRFEGHEGLFLEIRKEADANAVEVSEAAKAVLNNFFSESDASLSGKVIYDQGEEIRIAVDGVTGSVISGGCLAALVIFLLVQQLWPTFIVVVSIPLSLMLTLVMMYFTGVTFNVMSLAGLALGVGMLVDNSTVVIESIAAEKLQIPDPREAALWGTRKVNGAILASTLTTIAVFAPLIFVEGQIGQLFRDVASTVSFSMASSLFVAVLVIPMLCSVQTPKLAVSSGAEAMAGARRRLSVAFPRPEPRGSVAGTAGYSFFNLLRSWLRVPGFVVMGLGGYLRSLSSLFSSELGKRARKAIQAAKILIFGFTRWLHNVELWLEREIPRIVTAPSRLLRLTLFATAAGMMVLAFKGAELFPDEGADRVAYELAMQPGQTLRQTEEAISAIEKHFLGAKGVTHVASVIGEKGSHSASLFLALDPQSAAAAIAKAQDYLSAQPALVASRLEEGASARGKPIVVYLEAEDQNELAQVSKLALRGLARVHGIANVTSSVASTVPELSVTFSKEKLNLLGVDPQQFIAPLRSMLTEQRAGFLQIKGEEIAVSVQAGVESAKTAETVRFLSVSKESSKAKESPTHGQVYLTDIAEIEEKQATAALMRLDRRRVAVLGAELDGADLQTASRRVQSAVKESLGDRKIKWRIGGEEEERKENQKSLLVAIALSIFLVYILLAAQFEDLVQPGITLISIPLCVSGVGLFLMFFGLNLSAMVFVGFIILVGASINTSIVMVEYANQLRAQGVPVRDAIVRATVRRVRPIIVTTASNILGLIPMAFSFEAGSALQRPLAVTLIGGLISSTVLTLVVVPIAYVRFTKDEQGIA